MPTPHPAGSSLPTVGSGSTHRDLIELVPQAMLLVGADSSVVMDANRAALKLFGVRADDLVGLAVDDLCPTVQPDGTRSSDLWTEHLERARNEGEGNGVFVQRVAGAIDLPCVVGLRRLGPVDLGVISVGFEPLTARGHSSYERDLLARALMDSPVQVLVLRSDGSFRLANPAACRALGYGLDELDGLTIDQVDGAWRGLLAAGESDQPLGQGGLVTFRSQQRRRDGSTSDVRVSVFRVRHGEEELLFGFVEPRSAET
ncbi:PAS domain S-box protein [Engelhardtia mirabilis]|uniref:PAS fold protein n=1 Tax=Engelhardtia mirabilis TaxID=2528011 RepID=A0A518BR90_9BACT|nr:PAS fold protein [Planctomycetes bacterium Pla133]QDV03821.1 PAS fold protein [Planctomycetes bacterium Pla86]